MRKILFKSSHKKIEIIIEKQNKKLEVSGVDIQ